MLVKLCTYISIVIYPVNTLEENKMGDFFKLVAELGFPIAGACAAGYFVFLTLKFILAGVTSSVNGMGGIIKGLDIKQWQLSNVIKLRVAGMEDASL